MLTWGQRVRQRAEELRRAADLVARADTRANFLSLAADYDGLTDQVVALLGPTTDAALLAPAPGHHGRSERWGGLGDQ
ncbi:MAG TPA: hypothetical protein VJO12_07155 [Stellaceae bacterium]|nr:hypothetical protein [Stellaceae bacterium]